MRTSLVAIGIVAATTSLWSASRVRGAVSFNSTSTLTAAAGSVVDCNANGVADALDIAGGTSTDCNSNGVPDECDMLADKLLALDGAESDSFGASVAVSGDTAVIGSPYDDDRGDGSGSAYVFHRVAGVWQPAAKLTPADGAPGDFFGFSVAVSGDIAVIGAYGDDDNDDESGSAYVFQRVSGVWQQKAKLTAADGAFFDYFGYSVAVSGTTAIVGAYLEDTRGNNSGSAYLFQPVSGVWQQRAKLTAADGAAGDVFGWSVAVSGNIIVVGAWGDNSGTGTAYVFEFGPGMWAQRAKLAAPDGAAGDQFGISVALSGGIAVIGAFRDDDNGSDSGSAYMFERNSIVSWGYAGKLSAADGAAEDWFGRNVAVSGLTAIVSGYGDVNGSVYMFRELDVGWGQVAKFSAADGAADDVFGAVALSGDIAIIGASSNHYGDSSGSAYVFSLSGDCNGNGISDVCDLSGNDCNSNSLPDECELAVNDCNSNGVLDECDLDGHDCDTNGIPDDCEGITDGDYDGNDVVDLNDYAFLADCLAGPNVAPTPTNYMCTALCRLAFDLDGDLDVDLHDIYALSPLIGP